MSAKPSFLEQLQRRNVLRAAAFYAASGWLVVQVATQVFPFFHIDEAVVRWIVIAAIVGLPFALVFAWFYELTPQGVVRESDIDRSASITARSGKQFDKAIIAVLALAVIALLFNQFVLHRFMPDSAAPVAAASSKSIAVLPFDNLSDDKNNAYFASGIQDEILTRLAGIADLKVISRTSTQKYASRPDNLKTVAAELGVATLLEGSVQKSGERVRVSVQLIDALGDTHLWASTYDRDLKDAFAVESEVSQDIADALKAKLSPSESSALAALPTHNAAAYDAFLKAEHAFLLAQNTELDADQRVAEDGYRSAIMLDPDFALARARYARCRMARHWFIGHLSAAELSEVKTNIDLAIALSPALPEAQVALGYYWYWGHLDYDRGGSAFQRAAQRAPSNLEALTGLASVQRRQGLWPQALATFSKAAVLGPKDYAVSYVGEMYMIMRRYAEAEEWLARSIAIDPEAAEPIDELLVLRLFADNDIAGARQLAATVPAERRVLFNYVGGDVMILTGPWIYPDIYERHFDDALKAWNAAPVAMPKQRDEKLAARVAIMTLAGQRQKAQADCTQLKIEREAQVAARPDDAAILTGLSWAYICLGRNEDAVRTARHATELLPLQKDAYFGAYYLHGLAQIDAWAGQPDEAIQLLEQLLSIPSGDYVYVQRLKRDPVWDPLRSDLRFQQLIAAHEAKTT
jgi:TolB-like protein